MIPQCVLFNTVVHINHILVEFLSDHLSSTYLIPNNKLLSLLLKKKMMANFRDNAYNNYFSIRNTITVAHSPHVMFTFLLNHLSSTYLTLNDKMALL